MVVEPIIIAGNEYILYILQVVVVVAIIAAGDGSTITTETSEDRQAAFLTVSISPIY